jgi:hypothetical protein
VGFLKNFDDEHENDYEHKHVLNFAHGIPIPQNSAKALILYKNSDSRGITRPTVLTWTFYKQNINLLTTKPTTAVVSKPVL